MPEKYPELVSRILARFVDAGDTTLRFTDATGLVTEVTLQEFVTSACELAQSLRSAGLATDDVVAIRGSGGIESCRAVVAVLFAGMVSVPLVSLLGDADVEQILDVSGAKALLSESVGNRRDLRPHLAALAEARPDLRVIVLGDVPVDGGVQLDAGDGRDRPMTVSNPDAGAFVLFTSGTTSVPKAVIHSYATVMAEIGDWSDQLDLVEGGSFLQPFPLGHIGGLVGLFLALVLGRELLMLSSWNAAVALELIDRYGVTSMPSTPYFAKTLLDERDQRDSGLESLRTMESGGGKVGAELVLRADTYGIRLSRCYGSTEHPTVTTHRSTDPVEVRATTDGLPTHGSEVQILDELLNPVEIGIDGEVTIRGPEQFLGYLSGDTGTFLPGGWFRTGDIGHLTSEGRLSITGRLKEIIIRGGENISVPEVESVFHNWDLVTDAAVIGVPDDRYGERAYAFIVPSDPDAVIDIQDVRRHFQALGIAKYKIPEWIELRASLPRNALGKIQKNLLEPKILSEVRAPGQ